MSLLNIVLVISFINVYYSLEILNKTRYSNDFFFDKDLAIVESHLFSYFNSISSIEKTDPYQELINKFITFLSNFWANNRPFPSSIFFSQNLTLCLSNITDIISTAKKNSVFYTFFEATGKSMNDLGNEHHCMHNVEPTLDKLVDYYLLEANLYEPKDMTNYEDIYLLKFLNQNNFYIGICLPNDCEPLFQTLLHEKEFLDFLYDRISLSNFTISVDKNIRKDYENEYKASIFIKWVFFALLFFKIIISAIKSCIMKKDYDQYILEKNLLPIELLDKRTEDEGNENEEKEKNEKSLSSSSSSEKIKAPKIKDNEKRDSYFGNIYGISTKEENHLYNPFNDNQDKYPFYIKLIKLLDLVDNVKLLTSVSNKYYNSCGIKRIYFFKIIVMIMTISLKFLISQTQIPSRSFLTHNFYRSGFFVLIKVCIFAPVFWIILDAMTAGFKLMSFMKKNMIYSQEIRFPSFCKFFLLLIPKIFLFILYYIIFHIYGRNVILSLVDYDHHIGPFAIHDKIFINSTYSLRYKTFQHHLKCMLPIYINYIDYFIKDNPNEEYKPKIEGNGQPNPSKAINCTYYEYEKTGYKVPSPFLTNTDLFINIYLNEFVLLIFMMIITFLNYKIKHRIFDYSILIINVFLYFVPLFNWTNYEFKENEEYSLLYVLGQNFSEKYTHYFINFYYFGFMLGVMLFYQNENNYHKMNIKYEDNITINSIGSHNSSYDTLSSSSENSYIYSMPFPLCKDIILALNNINIWVKRLFLVLSIGFIFLISSTFTLIQKHHDDTDYDIDIKNYTNGEIPEIYKIIIPYCEESFIKFIFLYEKNLCCLFFFIFLMMVIVYPPDKLFIKFCNYNCFNIFERISFSTFCTFNFFVNASFCFFYLDFKIMMTNFFLNSLGIFILLLILNTFFVTTFELPFRIIIKSWMNKGFIDNLKNKNISGGLFGSSRQNTLAFK